MITQEMVRNKLIEKSKKLKIQYIAEQIDIPKEMLSRFKTGKRELWEESLQRLNDYLDEN